MSISILSERFKRKFRQSRHAYFPKIAAGGTSLITETSVLISRFVMGCVNYYSPQCLKYEKKKKIAVLLNFEKATFAKPDTDVMYIIFYQTILDAA